MAPVHVRTFDLDGAEPTGSHEHLPRSPPAHAEVRRYVGVQVPQAPSGLGSAVEKVRDNGTIEPWRAVVRGERRVLAVPCAQAARHDQAQSVVRPRSQQSATPLAQLLGPRGTRARASARLAHLEDLEIPGPVVRHRVRHQGKRGGPHRRDDLRYRPRTRRVGLEATGAGNGPHLDVDVGTAARVVAHLGSRGQWPPDLAVADADLTQAGLPSGDEMTVHLRRSDHDDTVDAQAQHRLDRTRRCVTDHVRRLVVAAAGTGDKQDGARDEGRGDEHAPTVPSRARRPRHPRGPSRRRGPAVRCLMGIFRDGPLGRRRGSARSEDAPERLDARAATVARLPHVERTPVAHDIPYPLASGRIVRWFETNDFSYFVDNDGDLGGIWRGRLFYFFLFGDDSEILQTRGQWNREVSIERLEEILDHCNDWNAERIWPKAYARVRDNGMVHVVTEVATDLEPGVTEDQLSQLLFCGLSTGSMFFDSLDELYPDPVGLAP